MATIISISDIANYVGQEVTIRGWVYDRTDKGKLRFIMLRDGTGVVQGVAYAPELPEAVFENASKVTQESSVIVTGTVRANEKAKRASPQVMSWASATSRSSSLPKTTRSHRRNMAQNS